MLQLQGTETPSHGILEKGTLLAHGTERSRISSGSGTSVERKPALQTRRLCPSSSLSSAVLCSASLSGCHSPGRTCHQLSTPSDAGRCSRANPHWADLGHVLGD